MTRKDYIVLAAALKASKPDAREYPIALSAIAAYKAWEHTVTAIAEALQADNAKFDRSKFFKAASGID